MELVQGASILIGQVFTAGAIYGALRADLRNMRERIAGNEAALARMADRIDRLLTNRRE